jgi:hypothetical protein
MMLLPGFCRRGDTPGHYLPTLWVLLGSWSDETEGDERFAAVSGKRSWGKNELLKLMV